MKSIEIDFYVEKALFLRRTSEEVSYNDVLRYLLGLVPTTKTSITTTAAESEQGDWVSKGVSFPSGTLFRATYNGLTYYGKVEVGALAVENKRYYSPSSAAVDITGNMVNGWIFWECQLPGRPSWQMIKSLRKK